MAVNDYFNDNDPDTFVVVGTWVSSGGATPVLAPLAFTPQYQALVKDYPGVDVMMSVSAVVVLVPSAL